MSYADMKRGYERSSGHDSATLCDGQRAKKPNVVNLQIENMSTLLKPPRQLSMIQKRFLRVQEQTIESSNTRFQQVELKKVAGTSSGSFTDLQSQLKPKLLASQQKPTEAVENNYERSQNKLPKKVSVDSFSLNREQESYSTMMEDRKAVGATMNDK